MTTELDERSGSGPSMIGRQLGRYTCVRELGAGGMAVLYLAQRAGAKGFTKLFALKRIKPKFAADPDFTRMFMREAKLSASLDHPNIAQVIDFGQDGQEHFLVMEYVHGPDLRRLLRLSQGGRLPLECAIAVITRVCAALHYAHEKSGPEGVPLGLVHRDVSATNVLLSMDGAVKLTDFGIAKGFGKDATGTSSGMLVGKPGYMSPEQVRCEALDRRSDVFCLGILLYEVTTGHRCFFGDSVFAILNATQRARYVSPLERDAEYPEALRAIVAKALQADPDQRYPSARALQLELEEFALDNRIRASDTVLTDYLASLDIELEDATASDLESSLSGTSIRDSGGTAFMLSGGAEVAPPAAPSIGTGRSRPNNLRWAALGVGLAFVTGLLVLRPWAPDVPAVLESPARAAPVVAKPTGPTGSESAPAPDPTGSETPAGQVPEAEASALSRATATAETPDVEDASAPPQPQARPTARRKRSKRKKHRTGSSSRSKNSELHALAPPSRRRD